MAAGDDWSDTGFVFTTDTGKPIEARNLIRKFHSLLEKAKVAVYRSTVCAIPARVFC